METGDEAVSKQSFTGFYIEASCLKCGSREVEISADGYDSDLYGCSWHLCVECKACKQKADLYDAIKSGARTTGL